MQKLKSFFFAVAFGFRVKILVMLQERISTRRNDPKSPKNKMKEGGCEWKMDMEIGTLSCKLFTLPLWYTGKCLFKSQFTMLLAMFYGRLIFQEILFSWQNEKSNCRSKFRKTLKLRRFWRTISTCRWKKRKTT